MFLNSSRKCGQMLWRMCLKRRWYRSRNSIGMSRNISQNGHISQWGKMSILKISHVVHFSVLEFKIPENNRLLVIKPVQLLPQKQIRKTGIIHLSYTICILFFIVFLSRILCPVWFVGGKCSKRVCLSAMNWSLK